MNFSIIRFYLQGIASRDADSITICTSWCIISWHALPSGISPHSIQEKTCKLQADRASIKYRKLRLFMSHMFYRISKDVIQLSIIKQHRRLHSSNNNELSILVKNFQPPILSIYTCTYKHIHRLPYQWTVHGKSPTITTVPSAVQN